MHELLSANLGRGHYSYAHFRTAPYSGGGWVSACGAYDWFKHGSRAAQRPIDFLEGDTVVACVERLAHKWRGCVVQFFIDNSSFQKSGAKGRSKAHRLNDLLRELLALMIKFGFVITSTWIATEENVDADHLSRGRVDEFLRTVYERGVWTSTSVPEPMPDIGRVRVGWGVMICWSTWMMSSLSPMPIPSTTSISSSISILSISSSSTSTCGGNYDKDRFGNEDLLVPSTYLLLTSGLTMPLAKPLATPLATPLSMPDGCGGRGGGSSVLPGLASRLRRAVRSARSCATAAASTCASASRSCAAAPEYMRALLESRRSLNM